ncbi:choice-of-anchor M domain-containing protein [Nesterenkonia haasae]|uniref:choice-of-anchor M domain-containing protein n=1 Tax=Nesterenkonia haasae TaxID=2587813 RepID=UPI0013908C85|nr:choice-of-anchor M domain-containing protein [Nesterenkonia haasae]NDK33147.1 hypothetical protein [Nesterenkonia haasae]
MSLTDMPAWRRLIALGSIGAFLLTGASAANAAQTPDPGNDDALDQTVERDEELGTEQVIIERGHVDIGPRLIDGQWQLLARDDTQSPPVWRSLEDMVFHLPETSIQQAPDDEDYAFLPAEPGEDLYLIPQTEDYEVPWLGWNTQDPEVVDQLVRGMTLRLHGVEGPGEFILFLQSGNFDPPQLLWESTALDEGAQDIWADTNTHVHGNWVFTEPGTYLLDVEVSGELDDGTTGSSRDTLRFSVGDASDPQEAFDAELVESATDGDEELNGQADDANPADADLDAMDGAADEEGGFSMATVALLVGAAILILGAAALALTLRSRRARQAAEAAVHSGSQVRRGR